MLEPIPGLLITAFNAAYNIPIEKLKATSAAAPYPYKWSLPTAMTIRYTALRRMSRKENDTVMAIVLRTVKPAMAIANVISADTPNNKFR